MVGADDRFEIQLNSSDGFSVGFFGVLDVLLFGMLKLLQCLVELALDFVLRVLGLLELLFELALELLGSDLLVLIPLVSLLEIPFELFNLIFEELNRCRFSVVNLLLVDIFLNELVLGS